MTERAPSRAALMARRWGSLAAAACLATLVVALVFATQTWLLRALLARECITVVGAAFVVLAFFIWGGWGRPFAYLGLKHFLAYPPLWVAGVTGAAGLIYSLALWAPLRELLKVPDDNAPLLRGVACVAFVGSMTVALLIHALLFVAEWVYSHRQVKRLQTRATKAPEDGAKALIESWDKLHDWLVQDAAVDNAAGDILGHHEIARRIARRLNPPCEDRGTGQLKMPASTKKQTPQEKGGMTPDKQSAAALTRAPQKDAHTAPKDKARAGGSPQLPSQAVVGALGSGKTTVRHLVERELAPDLRLVPVDLWPYHTPEAAVEGVLRSLIDAVAKEANVVAIRGLPAGYLRAMGSAGTIPSVLANLVDPAPNPYDTLESLDNLATAIGRRFVVWVEDLERFSAGSKGDDSPPDALRMAPIWSLLFGLSQRRSITVITATVKLQARFDLEKVARYIEELPSIAPSTGVPIIRAVRQRCLEYFAAPSRLQSEWDRFDAVSDEEVRDAMANKTFSLPLGVVTLARTPRTLKQGLRRVWDAWQRLAGEIDFDDLFLMCLLREAEPDVFALVRDNWSAVAGAGYSDEVRTKARETFSGRFNDLKLAGDTHLAVQKLLQVTFENGRAEETLQGVRHKRYWKRFTGEPEIPEDDSDQAVLRILDGPDDLAILELLEGPNHELVERFARELPSERLLRILLVLVPRRVSESPSTWNADHDPPGLIPLWRMIGDSRRKDRPQPAEIADHVEKAFVLGIENLALVHAIEHYFCGTGSHSPLYVDLDGALAERVRQTLWRLLVEHYAGQPNKLVGALGGCIPAVLPFLVWGSLRHSTGQMNEEPFEGWSQVADTILDACSQQPETMLLHLAALVADGTATLRGKYEYTFNAERARLLFGDEARVLELFHNPTAVAPEAEAVVNTLRQAAVDHLAHQPPPKSPRGSATPS